MWCRVLFRVKPVPGRPEVDRPMRIEYHRLNQCNLQSLNKSHVCLSYGPRAAAGKSARSWYSVASAMSLLPAPSAPVSLSLHHSASVLI